MVIIEAMSLGNPIVASDVGGVKEIVLNGENGYTLINDVDIFASKIEYILSNDSLQLEMGAKSKEIFKNRLTIDKMVDGYLKIYNKML